jgi:hypothetical protein
LNGQVTNVPKCSAEDTTLTATNAQGEKVVIPVPKGTNLSVNASGLHHNRKRIRRSFNSSFIYSAPFIHDILPLSASFPIGSVGRGRSSNSPVLIF